MILNDKNKMSNTDSNPSLSQESIQALFVNNDNQLIERSEKVKEERTKAGLDGLVGGLAAVIINTEPDHQKSAAEELIYFTGLESTDIFQDSKTSTIVLKTPGSADFLITGKKESNPFAYLNNHPKSKHLPNTRLETFVFDTKNIDEYVAIQKSCGIRFMTENILHTDNYSFIQTEPSKYTGNSIGFIQWTGQRGDHRKSNSENLDWNIKSPPLDYRNNIKELDHAATRVRAEERDPAILEFMQLTNYNFEFAIYVKSFNSITSVTRLSKDDFAMVFTSGIIPFESIEESGPTEKFIHNYGVRVHHLAFRTEKIIETYDKLKETGLDFLIELVGSREEGLRQTFSTASEHTLLVNEYIQRYDNFDGFFTKSNVTYLTKATEKQ